MVAVIELISSVNSWVWEIDVKSEWVWSGSYRHTTGKRSTDVNPRPDTVERFHSYSMCKYTLCHMHNHCTMEPVIRTTCTQRPPVRYCTVHNIKSTITAKHLCIESLENTYS